jgi:hypothetical protein
MRWPLLAAAALVLSASCGGTGAGVTPTPPPEGLAATSTTLAPVTPPADMLNPAVTQASIGTTICVKGYTGTIRPPQAYTEPIKRLQVRSYGYTDKRLASYEEDHVIALEIGGASGAKANLFPEPHKFSTGDDGLEGSLHSHVCAGRITLAAAQAQLFAVKIAHGYDRAKSLV